MVVDAVRTYLEAASGFTELTRQRAVTAAKTLLKESDERSGGAVTRATDTAKSTMENMQSSMRGNRVGHSIQALATDLIETSKANRAAIGGLVESEVERLLGRLDLVPRDEHDRLVRRVTELERRLAATQRRRTAEAGEGARTAVTVPEAVAEAEPVPTAEVERVPKSEAAKAKVADVEPEARTSGRASTPTKAAASARKSAVKPDARGTRAKAATNTRSRSAESQTKRATTRKNPGSAKDGSR